MRLTGQMHSKVHAATAAGDRDGRFVLLATRAEDGPADAEYESFVRYLGIPRERLQRIRLESGPLPELDLRSLAGIVVGGSPFTGSDPVETKSPVQLRVEAEMSGLLSDVLSLDLPFLGACYGVGTLGAALGGRVDTTFGEPVGAAVVELTDEGRADPLCAGLPEVFEAYVGHKEALYEAPPGSVLLATSATAPVQMLRVGKHVYATQFHPELDAVGIVERLMAYSGHGYYEPAEQADVVARVRAANVVEPWRVLRRFAELYG